MASDPLETLLDQLNNGDAAAAEKVFLAYEPMLRMVVRRLLPSRLKSKFDSVDIVQSIWSDVMEGFRASDWQFTNAEQLKAFLIKITRHRFIDRVRNFESEVENARHFEIGGSDEGPKAPDSRPSQVVQADELWKQMLEMCQPSHRELLTLKRQGYSLNEIAAKTGFHEGSIRRILYDLARKMAALKQQQQKPPPGFQA